ncbi:MAG: SOS response-associated peptidase [Pseudomarimonas sp.]
MCGRDTFFATWAQVREFSLPLPLLTPSEEPTPAYNRAPTQKGWVILANAAGADVAPMRWGLIPFWAKDAKLAYSTINARIESANRKPAFREAWKRRRCLVPSSGYYEWQVLADGKSKQPWFIHAANAPLLMFAGLWDCWHGPDGDIHSYSIITQPAAGTITQVHDRMPLILPPALYGEWMQGDPAAVAEAAPVPVLSFHPVGSAVGNVRQQGEGLIREIDPSPPSVTASAKLFA